MKPQISWRFFISGRAPATIPPFVFRSSSPQYIGKPLAASRSLLLPVGGRLCRGLADHHLGGHVVDLIFCFGFASGVGRGGRDADRKRSGLGACRGFAAQSEIALIGGPNPRGAFDPPPHLFSRVPSLSPPH